MANNDLLLEIMDLIEHPEKMPDGTSWNQHDWFQEKVTYTIDAEGKDQVHVCGTSYCFAGWAAYLDGYTEYVPPVPDSNGITYSEGTLRNPKDGKTLDAVQVQHLASDLLDINERDADALFEAGNTRTDLRRYVDALVRGESLEGIWPEDDDEEDED